MISKLIQLTQSTWWVFLFIWICYITYLYGTHRVDQDYNNLSNQLQKLKVEVEKEEQKKQNLKLVLDSQNDSLYIEMVLKKKLGLVTQGQKKVYFSKP